MWRQNKKSKPSFNYDFCKVNCFAWRYVVVYTRNDTEQVILNSNQSENKQKDKYEDMFPIPGDQNPDHRQGSLSTRPLSRSRLPYTGLTTTLTTSSTHFWMIPTAHIHYFAGVCCEPRSSIGTPPKFPSCDSEPSAQPHHRSGPGGHH